MDMNISVYNMCFSHHFFHTCLYILDDPRDFPTSCVYHIPSGIICFLSPHSIFFFFSFSFAAYFYDGIDDTYVHAYLLLHLCIFITVLGDPHFGVITHFSVFIPFFYDVGSLERCYSLLLLRSSFWVLLSSSIHACIPTSRTYYPSFP